MIAALACLLVVGCASGIEPIPAIIDVPGATSTFALDGSLLLTDLGVSNAPADFRVPDSARITDYVDQPNNIVVVFQGADVGELVEFWRSALPEQGWTITGDANESLLFERGQLHGAFTVTDDLAAVTIRSDDRS